MCSFILGIIRLAYTGLLDTLTDHYAPGVRRPYGDDESPDA